VVWVMAGPRFGVQLGILARRTVKMAMFICARKGGLPHQRAKSCRLSLHASSRAASSRARSGRSVNG
jgi:hypothetical protein